MGSPKREIKVSSEASIYCKITETYRASLLQRLINFFFPLLVLVKKTSPLAMGAKFVQMNNGYINVTLKRNRMISNADGSYIATIPPLLHRHDFVSDSSNTLL